MIEHKYRVKKKGLIVVLEELKQRIRLRSPKLSDMIKELDSVGLTDCSNKIREECTKR